MRSPAALLNYLIPSALGSRPDPPPSPGRPSARPSSPRLLPSSGPPRDGSGSRLPAFLLGRRAWAWASPPRHQRLPASPMPSGLLRDPATGGRPPSQFPRRCSGLGGSRPPPPPPTTGGAAASSLGPRVRAFLSSNPPDWNFEFWNRE